MKKLLFFIHFLSSVFVKEEFRHCGFIHLVLSHCGTKLANAVHFLQRFIKAFSGILLIEKYTKIVIIYCLIDSTLESPRRGIFNCMHATKHPALSFHPFIYWSVCLSVHHTFISFTNSISLSYLKSFKSIMSHPKSF